MYSAKHLLLVHLVRVRWFGHRVRRLGCTYCLQCFPKTHQRLADIIKGYEGREHVLHALITFQPYSSNRQAMTGRFYQCCDRCTTDLYRRLNTEIQPQEEFYIHKKYGIHVGT